MIKQKIGNIKGEELTNVFIKTSFHKSFIAFQDGNNEIYLMKAEEIFFFDTDFNNVNFAVIQNRKYKYLEVEQ